MKLIINLYYKNYKNYKFNYEINVIFSFQNNLKSGVYPASLGSLWLTISLVTAVHFAGYKVPYDLVGKVSPYLSG